MIPYGRRRSVALRCVPRKDLYTTFNFLKVKDVLFHVRACTSVKLSHDRGILKRTWSIWLGSDASADHSRVGGDT